MTPLSNSRCVAYFSMEIALNPAMPTYSGGLGILAGDTLRAAADLEVKLIAITLVHHKGYFHQSLDAEGRQTETPEIWKPSDFMTDTGVVARVNVSGRDVVIRIWRYEVKGVTGHVIPAYLLDTNLPQNSEEDRGLTDTLYGGDLRYRLRQEVILGLGGLAAIEALGHGAVQVFHMNEGHSSLLTLGLFEEQLKGRDMVTEHDVHAVRHRCVFTTHTPVPAGHDKFSLDLATEILGPGRLKLLAAADAFHDDMLNMTYLALRFSHYVNGVAMKHGEISRDMFPGYPVRAITNGVHAVTWTSEPFRELYDRHIPEWRTDNLYLRYAIGIPTVEIAEAHGKAKRNLIDEVRKRSGVELDPNVLTIGFARRAAKYKRADLLFSDLDRLRSIARTAGRMQVIYGGKAHPADHEGKETIRQVFQAASSLGDEVRVLYLENYDWNLASYLTSGVDLWLNTPLRPQEASGTSGMKAALNGVPSLSILDGWWIEGCVENATGWAIGSESLALDDSVDEIASLYDKLEHLALPAFYSDADTFSRMRRAAIALNGSFFNTERMEGQYLQNAYPDEAGG